MGLNYTYYELLQYVKGNLSGCLHIRAEEICALLSTLNLVMGGNRAEGKHFLGSSVGFSLLDSYRNIKAATLKRKHERGLCPRHLAFGSMAFPIPDFKD